MEPADFSINQDVLKMAIEGFRLSAPREREPDLSKAVEIDGQKFITARELVGTSNGRLEDWKLLEHLRSARERNWPFIKANEFKDGEIAICGSGPSIGKLENLKTLRRLQKRGVKIHAINRCHDFLCSKGIVPDSASLLDPIPNVATYIKPRKGVDYFIGFQCHPSTLDVFEKPGINKFIWFCRTTGNVDKQLTPLELAFATPSRTSTNGLRSVMLNYMRGFRRFHFFGLDSSYETELDKEGVEQIKVGADGKGKLHAHAKPETIHDVRTTRVVEMDATNENIVYEKEYFTNSAMLAQADEFILLIQDISQGIKGGHIDQVWFHVHGDGLIPDIACSVKYPFHADRSRIRTNAMPIIRPAPKPELDLKPSLSQAQFAPFIFETAQIEGTPNHA